MSADGLEALAEVLTLQSLNRRQCIDGLTNAVQSRNRIIAAKTF